MIGTIFVGAGLLLLSFNFNILPIEWKPFIFNWRALLVFLGLVFLFRKHHFFVGCVLLLAALILYLPMIAGCYVDFHAIFWPVILIVAGLFIIAKRCRKRHCFEHHHKNFCFEKKSESYDNSIDDVQFFSASEKVINTDHFEGGKIVAFFGGINLNLLGAKLNQGKNYIELVVGFGGCKMLVPSDWTIRIETVSIFGGIVDKRSFINKIPDPDKVLVIKGVTIFGGCEIMNN